MGNVFGKRDKLSSEEIRETRQARENYRNYLASQQTNVNNDVSSKRLTPDTGNIILEKIKGAYTWLQKNPNANYNEIINNYDTTNTEISRLIKTDKPKKEIANQIVGLKSIAVVQAENKRIDETQLEKLNQLSNTTEKWLEKNVSKATQIDFDQQEIKFRGTIREIVPQVDVSNDIINYLDKTKDMEPTALLQAIQNTERELEAQKNSTAPGPKELAKTVWFEANKVFFTYLTIFICLVSGSLAANNAIGRARAYRVLYFLYGAIPIYAPIVILYTIYRRIKEGPLPYYAPLPLSITPATTRLGKILWFPFYWIPDSYAVDQYDKYQQSLKDMITT
jgi:hypothetical protein